MSIIKEEPVRFWAAIMGLVAAVIALLIGFDIVSWSSEQVGLIIGVLTAVGVLFQFFFVRNQVTPVE
jgi:VIT1/CCC1 family predicted Fe2+/Mn2+ transporter